MVATIAAGSRREKTALIEAEDAGFRNCAPLEPRAVTPSTTKLNCRNVSGVRRMISNRAFAIMQMGRAIRAGSAVLLVSVALAGCAGTVNPPTQTSVSTTKFDPSNAAIGQVSAVATPGVTMTPEELSRIAQAVQADLASAYPDRLMTPGGPRRSSGVNVKLVFTRYDKGDAFARAMLAGLGQIHIESNVLLIDAATGRTVGTYAASKTFAWGGIYGGPTRVEDVEAGFARSVAGIFKKP